MKRGRSFNKYSDYYSAIDRIARMPRSGSTKILEGNEYAIERDSESNTVDYRTLDSKSEIEDSCIGERYNTIPK